MAPKPTDKPNWIPDNTTGIVPPGTSKQSAGWFKEERPPYQFFNWFWNRVCQWIDYFSGNVKHNIIIDTDTDEGDYTTLAAYIADSPAAGDRVLVKVDEEITGSTMVIPANIQLEFLKGKKLWCDENLTTVLQFGNGVVTKGDLLLELSHTGTVIAAVSFNGDSNSHANIIVKNTSTGTITDAFKIEPGKIKNHAFGEVINSGGGTVTYNFRDSGCYLSNCIVIRGSDLLVYCSNEVGQVNWIQAEFLGETNIPTTGIPAVAAMTGSDVAFIDETNKSLRTYRWNGSGWTLIGSGLSLNVGQPALTALNDTDVALLDSNLESLRTYRFNGSTWSLIGSGLSVSGITYPSLAALNETDIAFVDNSNDELRVYRFNGSTWSQVGSSFSLGAIIYPKVAALSETDVAVVDPTTDLLRVYRFNGSVWSSVGSGLNISGLSTHAAISSLNKSDIAYFDANNRDFRVYRFNGSVWVQIGIDLPSGDGTNDNPTITALNGTDIVEIDLNQDDLRVYRFAFSIGKPHNPAGGAW